MAFDQLETERLVLANIADGDRDFILAQFSDAFINRYLFDAEPLGSPEEAQELIDFYTRAEPRSQHRWILVLKGEARKIGTCGFHCINYGKKSLELGYDLVEDCNGRGYMGEALGAIMAYARESLGMETLEAHVSVDNAASIRLLERLGFTQAGEMSLGFRGRSHRHIIYRRTVA